MARAKKTKKIEEVKIENESPNIEQFGEISLTQEKYDDCEWCFQFDEDEPQIFAWTDGNENSEEEPTVTFTITNRKNSYITFTNSKTGKVFKLFAREISTDGKQMREQQVKFAQQLENDRKNFENGSENKEA